MFVSSSATASDLEITFENLNGKSGMLLFLLFDQKKGFPRDSNSAVKRGGIKLNDGSNKIKYQFKNISNGSYALSVVHDANGNNKLDTGLFGIPTEGYGCSNNPRPVFRSPTFEECAFDISKEKQSIIVKLLY